jgi:micrococcal nuclease
MVKQQYIYNAKIINVVDGDTVDVIVDLGFYISFSQRLRLKDIDTSELNSPDQGERIKAQAAKAWMLVHLNKNVIIETKKKDKYGRFLADIYIEGVEKSLNTQLLEAKLATKYGA